MTYVIGLTCVDLKDKTCIEECPVDCIYEGDRMLYIHPDECVDCGACEPVCPVEAIVYEDDLSEANAPFAGVAKALFAEFGSPGGASRAPRGARSALCRGAATTGARGLTALAVAANPARACQGVNVEDLRVAVVGSGPAGIYTAAALTGHDEAAIDVIDRLPTPFGLVRYGVAPDHEKMKSGRLHCAGCWNTNGCDSWATSN